MKNILFLGVMIFASGAFANADIASVVEAFTTNKAVLGAIETTSQEIRRVHGRDVKLDISKPTAVLFRYSCGTKGCSSHYLVTTVIAPRAINPQGVMVAATVYKMGSHSPGTVTVLDRSELNKLLNVLFPK